MDKKQSIHNFGAKGWFLIIYSFLALFCNVAMTVDGLNVALPLLTEGQGLNYEACLGMGTVAGFISVVLLVVVGKIREKVGSRITSSALMVISGLVYMFVYLNSTSVVMYAIALSLLNLCTGALQAQWFPRKRGVVVGISTTGANVGSAILVPLMTLLTTVCGWKLGLSWFGLFSVVIGVLGFIILRDNPLDAGYYPDNVSKEVFETEYLTSQEAEDKVYRSEWTLGKLLRTKEFYAAAVIPSLVGLALIGIVSQFVSRNMSLGLTQLQAVGAMTVAALFGMLGSYLFGVLDTKRGTKIAFISYCLFFAAAVVCNILGNVHIAFVYVSIALVGASLGGITNFTISYPCSIFGQLDYPFVNTYSFPITNCIQSCAFAVNAVVLSVTGRLDIAYIVFAVLLVIAAIWIALTDATKWNKDVHPELMNADK